MSLLEGEAYSTALLGEPATWCTADTLVVSEPSTPQTPTYPDEEWPLEQPDVRPLPADGIRVTVSLFRAVTLEHVGDIATAVVEDWSDDVDVLEATDAGITASSYDPIWEAAARRRRPPRARLRHRR